MRYVVIGAGWLWGLAALPQVTDAAVGFFWFTVLLFGGGSTGLVWGVYSFAAPDVFRVPRVRWMWLSVPVIGVSGFLLGLTHRDLALRVWLCNSELREYAEAARQNPEVPQGLHRLVGLFKVGYTSADEKQVMLYTAGAGFMDSAGIVYRPDGQRPDHHRCRYEHLYGPWWWFWEKF